MSTVKKLVWDNTGVLSSKNVFSGVGITEAVTVN